MPCVVRARMRCAGLIAAAAVMTGQAGVARAQDPDPTARYDVDDALGRHPHDISELPDDEEARGRRITFDLGVTGTWASNAGNSRFNAIDAGYVTPAFGLSVTPVTWAGWAVGGGALLDADFYGGGHDDAFGEGRLEGFVFARRPLGPGAFTAEVIAMGVYGNDFTERDLTLLIANLTYNVSQGGASFETAIEYQDSDIADLRRGRVSATLGYTLPERLFGYGVTLEGDLAVSDFTSGANRDRRDATTAMVLIAERELAQGWSLEWEAAVVKRFSNRSESEFTALDLGVEITRSF